MRLKRKQAGLTMVEFAMIGTVLLLVIFGVIEFGRLLWTWQSLAEATRRGARVAAVCPINHPSIARVTVFNNPDPTGSGASAVIYGLNTNQVSVSYLDADGNTLADPMNSWSKIAYVRVAILGFVFNFAIPLVGGSVSAPEFETTLPAESLGVVPGVGFECYGIPSPWPTG